MRYFLLFLLIPSWALAYDDLDAAQVFGKCIGQKSRDHYYSNGALLVQACQPEYELFIHYCTESIGEENCQIIVARSIYGALKEGRRRDE